MHESELIKLAGSHMALRNLVADQMGLERCDDHGCSYGDRVLNINWE